MKVVTGPLTIEVDGIGGVSVEGRNLKPEMRTLAEMKGVLLFDDIADIMPPATPLYSMYRSVCRKQDEQVFAKSAIRFDVTVIPFVEIGREHNKTLGHYHPAYKNGSSLTFPEIYQVLDGEAHFILQKRVPGSDELEKVYWVHAVKGDKLLIPPNYGHVTVNPAQGQLVLANLVEKNFKSEYEPYKRKCGAAYYDTEGGLVPNDNYCELPEAVQMGANEFSTKSCDELACDLSAAGLYALFLNDQKQFSFLTDPSKTKFRD